MLMRFGVGKGRGEGGRIKMGRARRSSKSANHRMVGLKASEKRFIESGLVLDR